MLFVQKVAIGGKDGDKVAKNAAEAFRLLRAIMLQNLPLYFKDYLELPIFKSRVFKDHWSAFVRWSELFQKYNQECNALGVANGGLHMCGDGGSTISNVGQLWPGMFSSQPDSKNPHRRE